MDTIKNRYTKEDLAKMAEDYTKSKLIPHDELVDKALPTIREMLPGWNIQKVNKNLA